MRINQEYKRIMDFFLRISARFIIEIMRMLFMSAKKTVVFDFDGVISDSRFWYEDVSRVINKHTDADYQEVLDWMIIHGNSFWLNGKWDDVEFVARLSGEFGIKVTDDMMKEAMQETMHINAEVKELLNGINARILVFTDNPLMRIKEMKKHLPMVEKFISSQDFGGEKKNEIAFSRAIKENRIPSGSLFIDDSETNRLVAEKLDLMPVPFMLGDFPIWQLKLIVKYYLE